MFPFPFYDARGNTYFVATPEKLREFVDIPTTAADAAQSYNQWAPKALEISCLGGRVGKNDREQRGSDGLLVGPFPAKDGFGLLIVNTDGSLAERSGNGLTIFSQFLVDTAARNRHGSFFVHVYHDRSKPIRVQIEPAEREGRSGFWIDMGIPTFGPEVVEASPVFLGISELNGRKVSRVFALEKIDPDWTRSQFVSVGNPHCVTFLKTAGSLPLMDKREPSLTADLAAIAYSSVSGAARGTGQPCKNGVNLQWAFVVGSDEISARVFERGEGWTRSSGSSATAVASAARHLGLITATTVRVTMLGGVAPVRFDDRNRLLERAMLFGEATLAFPPA